MKQALYRKPFAGLMKDEVTREEIFAKRDNYHIWDFDEMFPETFDDKTNGYEDYMDELKSFTAEKFAASSVEEQDAMVARILAIYREVDVFPITYFSRMGAMDEISRCLNTAAGFVGDTVSAASTAGSALCHSFMPNLQDTASIQEFTPDKEGAETAFLKFKSDKFLEKAIRFTLSYDGGRPVPGSIFGGLRLVGSAPTNFRPMNAKAIYERFTPEGGTIYDFSAGFGGRMVGALTSQNGYRYIATDPNTETMYNLHRMAELIEDVTGRQGSYELHCCGSENMIGPENSVDFAFSSPPYFNLEQYSAEETQSYNMYPDIADWLEGYVRPTIQNIRRMLKPGHFYAVNIADFETKGQKVNFVDAWADISEQEGMPRFSMVYLGVKARAGSSAQSKGETKKENIMIFKNEKDF